MDSASNNEYRDVTAFWTDKSPTLTVGDLIKLRDELSKIISANIKRLKNKGE